MDTATTAPAPLFKPLSENNYHEWKFNMQALLQRNMGWLIISDVWPEPSPKTSAEWREWAKANFNAAGIIYSHVEPSIQPLLREYLNSAKEMWGKLEQVYSKDNATSRFLAYDEFFSITKEEDESLTALVARVEDKLQKLRSARSDKLDIQTFESELAAMVLIRALPEEFNNFRSTLLHIDDSISLRSVKEAFLQEERVRAPRAHELAMKASASSKQQQQRGKKASGSNQNANQRPCTHPTCKNKGSHSTFDCFTRAREIAQRADKQVVRKKGKEKANQAEEESSDVETAEFAGNASAFDLTDPCSPLVTDAGADWIADTGATSHMTPHRHWFSSYTPFKRSIRLADSKIIYSVGKGSVRFSPLVNGKPARLLEFHDVLHVPDLRSNLLSVLFLTEKKSYEVKIQKSVMYFKQNNRLLFTASVFPNHHAVLNGQIVPMSDFAGLISTCPLDSSLWHRRFCHLNKGYVHKLLSGELVTGITVKSKSSMDPICEPCLAGKQRHADIPRVAQHHATVPLALVHSDVHGPLPVRSRHHYRYWITFIDDASRFWAVLPLKDKAGAFAAFKQFKAVAENQLNCRIKVLRNDKGGEYVSTEFKTFCSAHGIQVQHTERNEPHQNGVAERANRTLHESVISMLNESRLPATFWWDAVTTFVHVHNRSPTSALRSGTPYEHWHKSKPDVSHFRVFGCTAYVYIKKDKRKQLQSHTQKCVFIGYPPNFKAWLFWNPVTKQEVVSSSAEFDERFFPGTSTKPLDWPLPPLSPRQLQTHRDPVDQVGDDGIDDDPMRLSHFPTSPPSDDDVPPSPKQEPTSAPRSPPPARPSTPPPASPPPVTPVQSPQQERSKRPLMSPASDIQSPEHVRSRGNPLPRPRPKAPEFTAQPMADFRPGRTGAYGRFQHIPHYPPFRTGPSETLGEPFTLNIPETVQEERSVPQAQSREEEDEPMRSSSPDPLDMFTGENAEEDVYAAGCQYLSLEECIDYCLAVEASKRFPSEPNQYKDIRKRPDAAQWYAAAVEEFTALLENGTFEPVALPPGRKAIGCRWVFKLKRKPDGSVDRYKGRLVAQGFSQRPGLDFGQVFAPTARWAALRAIFALAALEDLELFSLDISNAFLNGELDHDVYMRTPEGFQDHFTPGSVLKLKKALYGLKQSGHQWHKKLDEVLKALSFKLVRCDNSIWVYKKDKSHIIVPVYVDDMTVACKTRAEYTHLVGELKKHFKLKELGPLSSLLGVGIERDRSKRLLTLSQKQFIMDVLERFGQGDCSPVTTPLDPGMRLSKDQAPQTDEERKQMDNTPYAQLVGALMYLAVATRPDIAHAVGVLSRFSSNPGPAHWKAAKHLCRYLQGTKDLKLHYAPDPEQTERFTTYADADFGGDPDSRRSTSGMVVKMGTGAISWASKLQPVVTLSTTEAEYISACSAGQEVLWLRNLFSEMGYPVQETSPLHLDNQSAIAVSKNPEHHGRMKHLDLRHYWLRDVVKDGLVEIKYTPTKSMPADIMTKALSRSSVIELREMMGLRP